MRDVCGSVERGFEGVRDGFAGGQANDEGGAQLCVYRGGQMVVDLWTGRDLVNDRSYDADTITVLMSCTKGVTALCLHMLAERGLVDYAAPVAHYWPEFAASGKERVTVADLLAHRAGLIDFDADAGIVGERILDWELCTRALAEMEPLWKPGSAFFYHAFTFGFLVGEVIRRVSGKTVGQFVRSEIAEPLKLDLWIGLPAEEEGRVAPALAVPATSRTTIERGRSKALAPGINLNSRFARCVTQIIEGSGSRFGLMNTRAGHAAELPAGNGIGNARALARMYAAMIAEIDGIRLVSPVTIEECRRPQTEGLSYPPEITVGAFQQLRFGLGFGLPRMSEPMLGEGSFGHSGAGGRISFAHPEAQIAVAYVCNAMPWDGQTPDDRWLPWTKALLDAM